jgi:hypothetical protein
MREDAERALCGICGGVANVLRRHTGSQKHRTAALTVGLPPGLVDRPERH